MAWKGRGRQEWAPSRDKWCLQWSQRHGNEEKGGDDLTWQKKLYYRTKATKRGRWSSLKGFITTQCFPHRWFLSTRQWIIFQWDSRKPSLVMCNDWFGQMWWLNGSGNDPRIEGPSFGTRWKDLFIYLCIQVVVFTQYHSYNSAMGETLVPFPKQRLGAFERCMSGGTGGHQEMSWDFKKLCSHSCLT